MTKTDDRVARFNERTAAKSREVCERIEREDERSAGSLQEAERRILEAWPRFEDGGRVWLGDRYVDDEGVPQVVHGVELWAGGGEVRASLVCEDGWHTFLDAGEPAKSAGAALDSRGMPLSEGDTVRSKTGEIWTVESASMRGFLPGYIQVRSGDAMTYFEPHELVRIEPDSWEKLEEDAGLYVCDYARAGCEGDGEYLCAGCPFDADDGVGCKQRMARDIVRRARALAERAGEGGDE